MKIALVHSQTGMRDLGGTEIVVRNLASALVSRGHTVDIYTNSGNVKFDKSVTVHRIPYINLPFLNYLPRMVSFSLISSFFILLRKYDVVHCHFYVDGFFPLLLSKLFKRKTIRVYTFHGFLEEEMKVAKLADKKTTLTEATKQHYEHLGLKNLIVVPNGVNTRIFARDTALRKRLRKQMHLENKFVVIAVGRPVDLKNPGLLYDIISKTRDRSIVFLLIGISEAEPLRSMQSDQVVKIGIVPNSEVRELYSAADVFVMTSKQEGFPLVVLEAMASKLPCVVTNTGGLPYLVHKDVGFVVTEDAHEFVGKITFLKKNKSTLKYMSENSRKYVEKKFTWEHVAGQFERIYRDKQRGVC